MTSEKGGSVSSDFTDATLTGSVRIATRTFTLHRAQLTCLADGLNEPCAATRATL